MNHRTVLWEVSDFPGDKCLVDTENIRIVSISEKRPSKKEADNSPPETYTERRERINLYAKRAESKLPIFEKEDLLGK